MRRQVLLVLIAMLLAGTTPFSGEVIAQGPPHVLVTVSCPAASGHGPLNVTVNPWVYARKQGDSVEWKLNINGSSNNSIEIHAKAGWPFQNTTLTGSGSARNREPMKASAEGSYDYDITIYCGSEKVVIDPKMIVDE